MKKLGRPRLLPLTFVLLTAIVPPLASAHDPGSYGDIFDIVIVGGGCLNCHASGSQNGGFVGGSDEDSWYSTMVGARPSNAAAANLGQLRVAPYQPWNSFFLDKLSGNLKTLQGRPMPAPDGTFGRTCPGAIDKIAAWIAAGAKHSGYEGDPSPGTLDCDKKQPDFTPPATPVGGVQALGDAFQIAEPAHESEKTTTVPAVTASDLFVDRIQIVASAGTEYVAVTREGDSAPLAVARGESLDLTLPDGVALQLPAGKGLVIRQRIRNDYWTCPQPLPAGGCSVEYVNQTTGNVAVNLHSSGGAPTKVANPFIDTTGTQALFAPPRGIGQTGGAWTGSSPATVTGAVVGLWTDGRALEVTVVDAAGQTLAEENRQGVGNTKPSITRDYVKIADAGLPIGTILYHCTHGNGSTATEGNTAPTLSDLFQYTSVLSTPYKYGCAEMASPLGAVLSIPAGTPLIAGGTAARDCAKSINDPANSSYGFAPYVSSDCSQATVDSCQPANLVGGDGVNDGRCSLVGLAW